LAKIQPGKQQETLRNMLDVVLDWVSTHNLTLARALPDSTICVAVRETDVTESRDAYSLFPATYTSLLPEIVVNNQA
jgi:hypothetical protein